MEHVILDFLGTICIESLNLDISLSGRTSDYGKLNNRSLGDYLVSETKAAGRGKLPGRYRILIEKRDC